MTLWCSCVVYGALNTDVIGFFEVIKMLGFRFVPRSLFLTHNHANCSIPSTGIQCLYTNSTFEKYHAVRERTSEYTSIHLKNFLLTPKMDFVVFCLSWEWVSVQAIFIQKKVSMLPRYRLFEKFTYWRLFARIIMYSNDYYYYYLLKFSSYKIDSVKIDRGVCVCACVHVWHSEPGFGAWTNW